MNHTVFSTFLFCLFAVSSCSSCSSPPPPSSRPLSQRKLPAPSPLKILRASITSDNPSEQILALHAIHLSQNDDAHRLIALIPKRAAPEVELTKVQVLGTIRTEEASRELESELISDEMLIRMEALYALASRRDSSAYYHLEAEFSKIDPNFQYLFPELFAIEGSIASKQFLKQLLRHSDPYVRLGAVSALYKSFPDELLGEMKYLRRDPYPAIQEILLEATLNMRHRDLQKEGGPIEQLAKASKYGELLVAFHENRGTFIEKEAEANNLFAIQKDLSSTILYKKMQSSDLQVKLNATAALLEKRDPSCLKNITLLFCPDGRDLFFEKVSSPGKVLEAFRATPSASEQFRRAPWLYEKDLAIRQDWLTKTVELPESAFLQIARLLFKTEQNELIPLLVRLLENQRSNEAIELLKQESEHFGSPFIRATCTLALFRLHVEGPYYERLLDWVKRFHSHDLLKPRPTLPWNLKEEKDRYSLSFEETSNLLVESYEALAESHKDEAIQVLREAILHGNSHNRPILAGILLKAEL